MLVEELLRKWRVSHHLPDLGRKHEDTRHGTDEQILEMIGIALNIAPLFLSSPDQLRDNVEIVAHPVFDQPGQPLALALALV